MKENFEQCEDRCFISKAVIAYFWNLTDFDIMWTNIHHSIKIVNLSLRKKVERNQELHQEQQMATTRLKEENIKLRADCDKVKKLLRNMQNNQKTLQEMDFECTKQGNDTLLSVEWEKMK